MLTTHTWNDVGKLDYLYNKADYTDSQPFQPGDTLIIEGGEPDVAGSNGNIGNLLNGTYLFQVPSAGGGFETDNIDLDPASTIAFSGPGAMEWQFFDQFINDGTIQVGSSSATANVTVDMGSPGSAALTNNGSITVRNNTLFKLEPILKTTSFINAVGGTLNISDEGGVVLSSSYGYGFGDDCNATNNGLIDLNGTAGVVTAMDVQGSYQGSGLLSVRGAPGENATNTYMQIAGPASGIFDVASGELKFSYTPVSGAVNFLDNNGILYDNRNNGVFAAGSPFGATIYGFQAGDQIDVYDPFSLTYLNSYSLSWNASTNTLTLLQGNSTYASFKLAGSYQQSDFQLTTSQDVLAPLVITTTSTVNAVAPFAVQDVTTGAVATNPGQQYTGPVNYLQSQYAWSSPDKVNVTASLPDVYLVGGAGDDALAAISGSNVLDGGAGSNFLTGAKGADGGQDTFFLDASKGVTWDTLVNFHPGDSVTLWGFNPSQSAYTWAASDGTGSYKGVTIHAAFAGTGTPINGSVTFAGISQATEQAQFSVSSGSTGGRDYLYIHYNNP